MPDYKIQSKPTKISAGSLEEAKETFVNNWRIGIYGIEDIQRASSVTPDKIINEAGNVNRAGSTL